MSEGQITFRRDGNIARINIDRPSALNALTRSMYDQLRQACDRIDADEGLRLAVLRGVGGKAFAAGTDVAVFEGFQRAEDWIAYERLIAQVVGRLEAVRIPTVAVIEGFAVGGGLLIAAACDLRICTTDAKFGVPIALTVGNCLSIDNYQRLASLIGISWLKSLVFTGGFLHADEAVRSGLVIEAVPRDDLEEHVETLCEQIMACAPLTLFATKEAVRRLAPVLPPAEDLLELCYESADFAEGVAAFIEKRPPHWTGR